MHFPIFNLLSITHSSPGTSVQEAQRECSEKYQNRLIQTLAVAAFAATFFVVTSASLAAGAMRLPSLARIIILASSPIVFLASAILIKKIEVKTQFWGSTVAEILVLQHKRSQCDDVLKDNPNDVPHLIKRAALCCQLSMYGHAKELETAAKDLSHGEVKKDGRAVLITGEFHRLRGSPFEALNHFNLFLRKSPEHYYALIGRAEVFQALRKNRSALQDFQEAQKAGLHDAYLKRKIEFLSKAPSRMEKIREFFLNAFLRNIVPNRIDSLGISV